MAKAEIALLFALLAQLILPLPVFSGESGIRWETDYAEARKRAVVENRPLLIYFFREGCNVCAQMESTFATQAICETLSRFVCLRVNVRQNASLPPRFAVQQVPTTHVLTVSLDDQSTRDNIILNNTNIGSFQGAKNPEELTLWTNKMMFLIWDRRVTEQAAEALQRRDLMRVATLLEGRFIRRGESYVEESARQEIGQAFRNALTAALSDARSRRNPDDETKTLIRFIRWARDLGLNDNDAARYRNALKQLLFQRAAAAVQARNIPVAIESFSRLIFLRELIELSEQESAAAQEALTRFNREAETLLAQARTTFAEGGQAKALEAAGIAWRIRRAFDLLPVAEEANNLLESFKQDANVGAAVTSWFAEQEAGLLLSAARADEDQRNLHFAKVEYQEIIQNFPDTSVAQQARALLSRLESNRREAVELDGRAKCDELLKEAQVLAMTGHFQEEKEVWQKFLRYFPTHSAAEQARTRLRELESNR